MLGAGSVQYTSKTKNTKTGPVITQFIGATRDESRDSCNGCPLLADKTCYAQFGSPAMGHVAILKAHKRGKDYSLENVLQARKPETKYVRFGAIGDPSAVDAEVLVNHAETARKEGLGVLGYTHHWRKNPALKGQLMASCDPVREGDTWNISSAVDAVNEGWKAALHIDPDAPVFNGKTIHEAPQGKVEGKKYFLCPAQRAGSTVQCNDCGLCDVQKKTSVEIIVFVEHGQQMKFKKAREEKAKV